MRSLQLSLARSAEENVAGLVDRLKQLAPAALGCDGGNVASSANASWPSLEVTLLCPIASFHRGTLLQHVEQLYDASAALDCRTDVSVIPRLLINNSGDTEGGGPSTTAMSKAYMTASHGFDPAYKYIAVGGTFDRLHAGHKLLLTVSAMHALDKLRVGITGPELLTKKKFAHLLQSFDERRNSVEVFLRKLRGEEDLQLELEAIEEFSGGTDRIAEVEALVASPETLAAIPKINALRQERHLRDIVPIPIHYVGGKEPSVSSSMLRAKADEQESSVGSATETKQQRMQV